ncbi:flagellar hook-length control protein FliK [Octadecabacter ascidiaceicola]|uniref:Flagellar hook-length control protein FliK n=1 Tax=Octadecabacter ascidiaceicola TaxID=1655543 RepID=A0A238KD15_9RHOB|nr:flagellar hook-length control protein FliK [Octadecabacter ascidiaceicola]SMX40294.1 Flagellar hook-length control protein FliK [Octadecabacter ascidiaceicola]
MILFDTNAPETGQTAQHGLRNTLPEKTAEDSIEFSEIWSEVMEHDTPTVPALPHARSSVALHSDTTLDRVSLDTEATEVQPEFHTEESDLIEQVRTKAPPPSEARVMVSENGETSPERRQTPIMARVLDRSHMLEVADPEIAQTPYSETRSAMPIAEAETVNPTQLITVAGDPVIRPFKAQQVAETLTVQDEAAAPPQKAMGVPLSNPILPIANETDAQLRVPLGIERAPMKMIERIQNGNTPKLDEGAVAQSTRIAPVLTSRTDQSPPSVTAPIPTRFTDNLQQNGPPPAHRSQEYNWASKPMANSNPVDPAKIPPLPLSSMSMDETTTQMLSAVPDAEATVTMLQHAGTASTATTVAATPPTHAPQVAAQIVAAVTQSSRSTTEILLNPDELGRVRISLSNGDAGIIVNILTERSETADLMRRNIEILERDLRDMGFENPSFTFGERPDGSNEEWNDEYPEPEPNNPSNTTEPPTPNLRVTLNGGLDLKL